MEKFKPKSINVVWIVIMLLCVSYDLFAVITTGSKFALFALFICLVALYMETKSIITDYKVFMRSKK